MSVSNDTPTSKTASHSAIFQPDIGEHIAQGRYRVNEYLGQGGMGQVYKATDTVLDRIVAIKLLNYGRLEGKFAIRFQQEAKALSNLSNSGILSVYDFGLTETGYPFMATEFVDGITLREYLNQKGFLSVLDAVQIANQIAKAMAHAHEKSIVHRDLKPENIILLEENEEVSTKILDFGISKSLDHDIDDLFQTPSGQIIGSPKYISPEQAGNKSIDKRSDIYSLGCIFFECLTGEPPFTEEDPFTMIDAHINRGAPHLKDKNPILETYPKLEEIVSNCIAKAPEDRYQTMDKLREALEEELLSIEEEELKTVDEDSLTIDKTSVKKAKPKNLKPILVFLSCLVFVSVMAVIYLMFSARHNWIGDIESQKKTELMNSLNIGKQIAKTTWHLRVKRGVAKYRSYGDSIPANAIKELPGTGVYEVEFKSSILKEGLISALADKSPSLRRLCFYECSITNSDLKAINKFKNLRKLILKHADLTDESFQLLEPNKNLIVLSVERNLHITKTSLEKIVENFPNLQVLNLGGSGVKGQDLQLLNRLKVLSQVNLQRLNLKNSDFQVISKLPKLLILDIGHNEQVTIKGLNYFGKQRQLHLKLKNLFAINDKDMNTFQKKHPHIEVENFLDEGDKLFRKRYKELKETGVI